MTMLAAIETRMRPLSKALSTSATDASFPSKVPTTTEPTGIGVLELQRLETRATFPSNIFLIPYGVGNDDHTFDMRVIGWRKVATLWVPTVLTQVAVTLSTAVGVAGAAVTNSERFADTISITIGNSNVSVEVVSPANNTVAHMVVDVKGSQKVELTFDLGSGTNCNALWSAF